MSALQGSPRLVKILILSTAAVLAPIGGGSAAQEQGAADDTLARMGRLVGGYWHFEGGKPLNAYNRFEWGLNKKVLHFRSYVIGEKEDVMRAEGSYHWHPARKKLVGATVGARGELYEGEVSVDGNRWSQEFSVHSATGSANFHETWEFPDDDTYVWTLYRKTPEGMTKQIQATVKRVKEKPGPAGGTR